MLIEPSETKRLYGVDHSFTSQVALDTKRFEAICPSVDPTLDKEVDIRLLELTLTDRRARILWSL